MSVLELLFWLSLGLTLYPYLGYPLLVTLLARMSSRPWRQDEFTPRISLLISVYNEEAVIGEKLENALALDYPEAQLEILVVSDGSTDRTNELVQACSDRRVRLLTFERAGKTACLNRALEEATGELVIFTDANSMFPRRMLKLMARNFSDEQVGLVSGWTKYRHAGAAEEEAAPGLYARLEMVTKQAESMLASCVGADGAIFAIRRDLYRRLGANDINDFVIPLQVVGQHKRVVLDPEVYCLEEPSDEPRKEFRRQARITNRTLGAIRWHRQYLNPFEYGWFAFFLLSHKLLRFMVPLFAAVMLLASSALMFSGVWYGLIFVMLWLFILAGGSGWLGWYKARVVDLCATFLLTSLAQLVGWFRFLTGREDRIWTPQR